MDTASPRHRRRWDALSPPKIAVLELAEGEPGCDPLLHVAPLSRAASAPGVSANHIPPLGLGRLRSNDGLLTALSARERSLACSAGRQLPPQPLTARPLGVTPRNAAMRGPRTDALVQDVAGRSTSKAAVPKGAEQGGARTLRSPRGAHPPQRSDAAARCGESHPRLLSRQAAAAPANDWALVVGADVAAPSDAHAWLHHALGGLVEMSASTRLGLAEDLPAEIRPEGVRATLLGPAGEGRWEVAPEHGGAPAQVLPAASLRRVAPAKGDLSRTVVGSAIGFQGEVLSVERSVAVVRGGAPGSAGARAMSRVRVLPLDTQCTVVRECTLRRS